MTALLILIGLCLVAAAGVVSNLPPAYESEARVALQPRPRDEVPSAAMITLLAQPYVTYATSDSTLADVSEATDVSVEELRRSVTVTMPAGSTNVEVVATFDDPDTASSVAAEVAQRIEDFAAGDRTLVADVVVPADEGEATTVDRLKPVLAPALLALGLILVVAGAVRSVLGARRRRGRQAAVTR
jgi:capsular polysaccharide biosynthesis protein